MSLGNIVYVLFIFSCRRFLAVTVIYGNFRQCYISGKFTTIRTCNAECYCTFKMNKSSSVVKFLSPVYGLMPLYLRPQSAHCWHKLSLPPVVVILSAGDLTYTAFHRAFEATAPWRSMNHVLYCIVDNCAFPVLGSRLMRCSAPMLSVSSPSNASKPTFSSLFSLLVMLFIYSAFVTPVMAV